MGIRPDPDYEIVVCPPSESFRWSVHEYPTHLAKWHHHPEYELHAILETSGRMMIGDFIGRFEPGCLVLTGPNLPHNWVSSIGPAERIAARDMLIQFTPAFGDGLVTAFPELANVRSLLEDSVFGLEFSGNARREGARLLAEIGDASGARRLILFLELLDVLSSKRRERRILSRCAPAPGEHTVVPDRLQAAIAYIDENYTRSISLGDVAAVLHLTPSTFSRFFKRQTGHTFAKFVNQLRVHRACRLLASTDLSITEICFDSGFNNTANFNRQFAAICRETPTQYRRSAERMTAREDVALPFRPRPNCKEVCDGGAIGVAGFGRAP